MQEDLDKWLNELKKSTTRYSILAILRDGDMHRYELRQEFEVRMGGVMILTEGNACPQLHKLESIGLVTSYWKDTGSRASLTKIL